MWRAHKAQDCKGLSQASGEKRKQETDSPTSKKKKTNFAKKLKVARAYVAKIEQQAKDCEDNDSDEDSE